MTASVCPLLTQRVAAWKVLKGSVRLLCHDFNEWELSFIDTWNFLLKSIISTLAHCVHTCFLPPEAGCETRGCSSIRVTTRSPRQRSRQVVWSAGPLLLLLRSRNAMEFWKMFSSLEAPRMEKCWLLRHCSIKIEQCGHLRRVAIRRLDLLSYIYMCVSDVAHNVSFSNVERKNAVDKAFCVWIKHGIVYGIKPITLRSKHGKVI